MAVKKSTSKPAGKETPKRNPNDSFLADHLKDMSGQKNIHTAPTEASLARLLKEGKITQEQAQRILTFRAGEPGCRAGRKTLEAELKSAHYRHGLPPAWLSRNYQIGEVPAAVTLSQITKNLEGLELTATNLASEIHNIRTFLGTMRIDSHGQACTAAIMPKKPDSRSAKNKPRA